MKIEELARIGDVEAWKLIFPSEFPYRARSTHPNWRPWQQPKKPLAIDKFVAKLAAVVPKRRDAVTLKSAEELAAPPLRIHCPYFHVRHSIWIAMSRGTLWAKTVGFHREKKPEKKAKQERAAALADAIKVFLDDQGIDWSVCHPMPLYGDRVDPESSAARSEDCRKLEQMLSSAQNLLTSHANQIKSDLDRISVHGNAIGHAWKAGFTASLGFCWRSLTGKDPSLSTKSQHNFLSFVATACVSIGGDPDEKWDRAVRQILLDRPKPPEWDGFDRYEHDRLPPGTQVMDWRDWEAKAALMREQALRDAQEYGPLIRDFLARRAPE